MDLVLRFAVAVLVCSAVAAVHAQQEVPKGNSSPLMPDLVIPEIQEPTVSLPEPKPPTNDIPFEIVLETREVHMSPPAVVYEATESGRMVARFVPTGGEPPSIPSSVKRGKVSITTMNADLTAKANADGIEYSINCPEKVTIVIPQAGIGIQFLADSMSYEDGTMKLTNVQMSSNGLKMRAATMDVSLDVTRASIVPTKPETDLVPQPVRDGSQKPFGDFGEPFVPTYGEPTTSRREPPFEIRSAPRLK